jgi:hypothetical protein
MQCPERLAIDIDAESTVHTSSSHHLELATPITALHEGDMAEFKVRVSPIESLSTFLPMPLAPALGCSPITPSEQPLGIHLDYPP